MSKESNKSEAQKEIEAKLPFIAVSDSLRTRITYIPPIENARPITVAEYRSYMPLPVGMEITYNKKKHVVYEHKVNIDKGVFFVIIK